MEVTITVNNVWSRISGLKDINLVDSVDKITSFYVEGYQFTRAFRNGWFDKKAGMFKHWDGKKHLLTQRMVFPTGLLQRISAYLKRNKVKVIIDDKREKCKPGREIKIKKYAPRDYQIEALNQAIKNERGIIRLGTGGGKTLIADTQLDEKIIQIMIQENYMDGEVTYHGLEVDEINYKHKDFKVAIKKLLNYLFGERIKWELNQDTP